MPDVSIAANKQLIRDFLDVAWNRGDFDLLRNMMARNFFYQTTFTDNILNATQYMCFVDEFRSAMPDLVVATEEIMAEDERVMSHTSFSGIVEKPVFGIPASDRIIAFPAISLWDVRSGKVASLNTLIDITGISRQLGYNISPGSTVNRV